jgi:2',3'-cyclic-nucleotide 2'-phosphodiesterase (5'-nucleotidase family)
MRKLKLTILGLLISLMPCSILAGDTAPGFKLEKVGGGSSSLRELSAGGNIVVLNFFDTKCEPCIKELPHYKSLYKQYVNAKDVKVRMISLDEDIDVLKKFIKKHNISIPVLRDPGGWKAASNYGVVVNGRAQIPQIFVIGKDGAIRKHIQGYHENVKDVLVSSIEFLRKEKVVKKASGDLTFLYTNSANGHLESCNCPENPFGGLVRRMSALKDLKKTSPGAVLLDAGDNFPVRKNKLVSEYVLKMMSEMSYDAVAIGDQELLFGSGYLDKNIKRLPFVAANISMCDDKVCWDLTSSYIIKEVDGVKVAILGVFNPDVFLFYPEDKLKGFKIENHIDVIKQMMGPLRKKADLIVLLSHAGSDDDRKIAEQVPGINLIVGGHSQTLIKEPVKVGDTLIVQAGKDGHRIGKLMLQLDNKNNIKSFENEFILLIKDIPDDKVGRNLLNEYNAKLKQEAGKLLIK